MEEPLSPLWGLAFLGLYLVVGWWRSRRQDHDDRPPAGKPW